MQRKVNVVGAGNAGLMAAKTIARYGIDVTIYDQKQKPGYPIRASGIVSANGLSRLGVNCSKALTNSLSGARIHAGNSVLEVKAKAPVAKVLDRGILNEICMDEAASEGVSIITGRKLSASELMAISKNDIIIGADGAVSEVATTFRMGAVKRYVLTYRVEYNTEPQDTESVDIYLDNSISPGLFSWVCPNGKDVLEVGVGVSSLHGNSKRAFDRFISHYGITEIISGAKIISEGASIIPIGLRQKIADDKNHVLLAGDAAGQTKASTGGGIVFGSQGGIMAGEAVADHMIHGSRLSSYESRFRRKNRMDLAMHSMISRAYRSLSEREMGMVIRMLNKAGAGRILGDYGDMDRPTEIIKRFILRRKIVA
jgi:geranylgeranyl reductase family protein